MPNMLACNVYRVALWRCKLAKFVDANIFNKQVKCSKVSYL